MPTTTGVATSFIDFTRASNATVTDSDGRVKWAPSNLLLASESFDAAAWTKLLATVTPNAVAAPNGTFTADKVEATANGAILQQDVFNGGDIVTFSAYFKKGNVATSVNSLLIRNQTTATNLLAARVNLDTGAITYLAGSSGATSEDVGNGWWKLTLTTPFTAGNTIRAAILGGYSSIAGEFSYVWGAHLYRSDLGGMQPNTSAYPMYNPTTPKNLLGYTEDFTTGWTGINGGLQGNGVETVSNGAFSTDLTGWTATAPATATWNAGAVDLARNSGSSVTNLYQALSLIVGRRYRVSITVSALSNTVGLYSTTGGAAIGSAISATGTYSFTKTWTSSDTGIYVGCGGSTSATATVDNISVQEIASLETGPNGLVKALSVSATSANGTLLSSISLLDSPYTFSVWLKRKTGGGNVQITVDGTTYATVAVTSTWTRFSTTLTPTAGTKTPGIRLVTSGDAVYAWGAQLSDSASLDSYVPVYGAAVTSAAYYGPRRDFDPVTLACKGLLVEEQRTNIALYSSDFSNAAWNSGSLRTLQVTTDQTTAPDGTNTADKVVEAAAGAGSVIQRLIQNEATASAQKVFSVYAKKAERKRIYLFVNGPDDGGWFDLDLGTYGAATDWPGGSVSMVPVGNGWYRCSLTPNGASTGTVQIVVITDTATTLDTRVGDGTSGVYIWGAQIENGSFATSYIPVGATTAGATRLADVASVSTQAFPYSATEGTAVINFSTFNKSNFAPLYLGTTTTGSPNIFYYGSDFLGSIHGVGGASAANNTVTFPTNNIVKAGYGYKSGSSNFTVNGTNSVDSTTAFAIANNTAMYIGGRSTGDFYLNGHIRQITYLPRRLANAELQTRTA